MAERQAALSLLLNPKLTRAQLTISMCARVALARTVRKEPLGPTAKGG